ncbi:MAG: LptF/LptG family permease [Alistipes sp.]|nr:LptF/LptG family permease [Candidatus Alistipes equi]
MTENKYSGKFKFWPGIKTLDWYIIRKFIGTYIFAIAMIIVIVVIFDYVEKIDDFTEMHAPMSEIIFSYYLNFIPFFVNQFSALFTFIAVIFFTSKLAYQTEIIAMLSGGMSFKRLMWPYFLGATFITALALTLSLWLIPISQRDCVEFEQKYTRKAKREREQYDRNIYRQVEPGTFAYVRSFNRSSSNASFFALEKYESNALVSSLEASDVHYDLETKRWTSQRYITRTYDEQGNEKFVQQRNLDTLINLDVAELGKLNELMKTMNIVELNQFMEQQRSKGSDSLRQIEVEHHTRYSYPFGTFILTLIGVSLSSRKVRGGTGLHIGVGIALCFSYIMFTRVFEEFAKGGGIPTLLAVWIPNIIFLIIAIYLYRKAPK